MDKRPPMPGNFVHQSALSRVVFQQGGIDGLGAELGRLEVRRPLVLSGRSTARSSIYERLVRSLQGLDLASYNDVPAHSSVSTVQQVLELARQHRADAFLAVGGGSASDTGKAAALWLAEGGCLEDHASRFTPPDSLHMPELREPKLPLISVPCTASGAEVTPSLGIRTDDGRKLLFWDLKLASRLIVIDAEANLSVPASLMLATGMNGLAHCVEGLYSKTRTPMTTALALHAIGLFAVALPGVAKWPQSVEHRAHLLAAAHLSGRVLINARTCLHHAICHALGAVTGAGHGDLNAVILPHAMAFNAGAAPESMRSMALAWPDPEKEDAVALVRRLQAATGVPTRLRDVGVPAGALRSAAEKVMGERGLYFNPRKVDGPGQIEALLEQAW